MCLLLLIPWLFIFVFRQDLRMKMLIMSCLFAAVGPLADLIYIQDWWKPETITRTPVGIESAFFGFVIAGVASTLYCVIFHKKNEGSSPMKKILSWRFWGTAVLAIVIFLGGFMVLRNSFLVTILFQLAILTTIFMMRHDLIKPAVISGFLTLLTIMGVYTLLSILTPGWIQEFWYFKNVAEVSLLNVPIDDFVWYLLVGASLGVYYEFWTQTKIESHS